MFWQRSSNVRERLGAVVFFFYSFFFFFFHFSVVLSAKLRGLEAVRLFLDARAQVALFSFVASSCLIWLASPRLEGQKKEKKA